MRPADGQNVSNREHIELTSLLPAEPVSLALEPDSTVLSASARLAVLDSLPVAVFLIDDQANIRFVNQRTVEMIGLDRTETLGRNVLDFVLVDDLDFAADLLNTGSGYAGETMGPSRLRYVDAHGNAHWTQVWASTAPTELGIDGYILTLTSESVRDVLASAVSSISMVDELDLMLNQIALSARAMPICGRGVILAVQSAADDAERFRAVGEWPLDDCAINAPATPWSRALLDGTDADIDDVATAELSLAARDTLLSAGVGAMFVRVIRDVVQEIIGVFVIFREHSGAASVNQVDHLNDAVRLAALAFAQSNRRLVLEEAAHHDALTGVANRTAFMERVRVERRNVDVLFIDLDHFKSVNDSYGHPVGDAVLAAAAGRIMAAVRHDDVVYRTGGDEFVVTCSGLMGDDERAALAQRIVDRLKMPFDAADHSVQIGATVGIASGEGRELADTVKAADAALYVAKERGRAGWAHSVCVS